MPRAGIPMTERHELSEWFDYEMDHAEMFALSRSVYA
jgi:hypothetical protein